MKALLQWLQTKASGLWQWLKNEPMVRKLSPIGATILILNLLGASGAIPPEAVVSINAVLAALGLPAMISARAETVGPVTAEQYVQLPNTDPTEEQ